MDEWTLDADVRRTAFDFLSLSTSRYGEVLPWKVLTTEFRYRGEIVPLIGASGIWKPKILSAMPISIATAPPHPSRPAPYSDGMDENHQLAYRYRGTDPAHRDNQGLRIAMQRQAPLIYFYGIEKGEYLTTWPVYVVRDDPARLSFGVAIDDLVISMNQPPEIDSVIQDARRQYITTLTVRRLHQSRFRARVLRAYRNRCAVCRLKHAELLDAAHIFPDSDPLGEPTVQNGLALCKIHHAAFDRHILGVRPDLSVEIRADILTEVDGPMLRYGLQEMDGANLFIPVDRKARPGQIFVEARYEQFKKALGS